MSKPTKKPSTKKKFNSDYKEEKKPQQKFMQHSNYHRITFKDAQKLAQEKIFNGIMAITSRKDTEYYEYIINVYFCTLPFDD